jgi:hypothetical protein
MKQLLNELDNVALSSIGNTNTTNNFMTKYHENHSYENCRLIKINENFSNEVWRELLKKIGLDLLCVAAHYSKRYEHSDQFIENKSDEELKSYTYYLKNTNPNNIVSEFCGKYITGSSLSIRESGRITIFSNLGTRIMVLYPNFSVSAGMISSLYCFFNLGE